MMSKRMSRYPSDRKVYVGDLGNNARKNELEYAFSSYGTLRSVWIARNPPGFAFVEFEDARDAADAVRGLDGRTVCGRRARVELSTGRYAGGRNDRKGSKSGGGGGGGRDGAGGGGRPFHPDDKCYECGGRGHYARDCRRYGRRRRSSRSKSRSRSYSRDQRTRSRTGSRSHSRSKSKSRSPKKDYREERKRRSTENDQENGVRHNDDTRNGNARSPRRRYDSSCSPKRHSRNRADSMDSKRSSVDSRRSRGARSKSRSPISKNHKD